MLVDDHDDGISYASSSSLCTTEEENLEDENVAAQCGSCDSDITDTVASTLQDEWESSELDEAIAAQSVFPASPDAASPPSVHASRHSFACPRSPYGPASASCFRSCPIAPAYEPVSSILSSD